MAFGPSHPTMQLPRTLNLYSTSTLGSRHWALGEHQEAPLLAVSLHSGWSGKADVVVHGGPLESSAPLATADHKTFGRGSGTVELFLLPQPLVVPVDGSSGFPHRPLTFAVDTAGRSESFQWRHSSGAAVDSLGGRGSGWKLVRLGADAKPAAGAALSSDGKEVVASWAWNSGSLTKKFKFQFLGSGATGELGDRFALVALASALKIWDRERRQRQRAAQSGGGGGA
ncbi:hypothetical protein GGR52DRAFT_524318 [Hypoxylon sp. FL1284]|nr:hypothetical protein GGR52DRAFT_524318 [Hypoxylon sp. FL1284]